MADATTPPNPIQHLPVTKEWGEFLVCAGFHLLLPLLPLLFEYWFAGEISAKSATISAAMYGISIGNSSRCKPLFAAGLVIGIIFSGAYGLVASQEAARIAVMEEKQASIVDSATFRTEVDTPQPTLSPAQLETELVQQSQGGLAGSRQTSFLAIGIMLVLHAIERYSRHVTYRTPFWEFEQ